jgi:hypothetical protein
MFGVWKTPRTTAARMLPQGLLNSICRAISSAAIHRQHVSARRGDQLAGSTISSHQLTAEIGRDLTAVEAGMVRQTAAIMLRCEQQQAAVVRGELSSTDELIRLASEARRLIASLKRVAAVAEVTDVPWSPLRSQIASHDAPVDAALTETEETAS